MFARFNSLFCLAATLAILAGAAQCANAAVIARWDFNGTPGTVTSGTALNADSSASVTGTPTLTPTRGGNKVDISTTGTQLRYTGSAQSGATADLNLSKFVIALTPSTSLSQFTITYSVQNANNGPTTITWTQTGGSGFTSVTVSPNQTTTPISTTLTTYTATFNGLTAVNGNSLTFTAAFSGASADNGQISFDSVTVNAVPEPVHYALALFGLAFVGTTGVRTLRKLKAAA